MLNVKDKDNTVHLTKRGLIKSRWFQKDFKPLFKKHLKGYRFLGAFIEKTRNALYYDFRFDTPSSDELNLEIDEDSGDIVHVTMNGDINLVSKEDLEHGHVSDLAEILLTFKNHIERKNKKIKISANELKNIIRKEVEEEEDEYLLKMKSILEKLEENKDNLLDILEVDKKGKVKRDDLGLPILKEEK